MLSTEQPLSPDSASLAAQSWESLRTQQRACAARGDRAGERTLILEMARRHRIAPLWWHAALLTERPEERADAIEHLLVHHRYHRRNARGLPVFTKEAIPATRRPPWYASFPWGVPLLTTAGAVGVAQLSGWLPGEQGHTLLAIITIIYCSILAISFMLRIWIQPRWQRWATTRHTQALRGYWHALARYAVLRRDSLRDHRRPTPFDPLDDQLAQLIERTRHCFDTLAPLTLQPLPLAWGNSTGAGPWLLQNLLSGFSWGEARRLVLDLERRLDHVEALLAEGEHVRGTIRKLDQQILHDLAQIADHYAATGAALEAEQLLTPDGLAAIDHSIRQVAGWIAEIRQLCKAYAHNERAWPDLVRAHHRCADANLVLSTCQRTLVRTADLRQRFTQTLTTIETYLSDLRNAVVEDSGPGLHVHNADSVAFLDQWEARLTAWREQPPSPAIYREVLEAVDTVSAEAQRLHNHLLQRQAALAQVVAYGKEFAPYERSLRAELELTPQGLDEAISLHTAATSFLRQAIAALCERPDAAWENLVIPRRLEIEVSQRSHLIRAKLEQVRELRHTRDAAVAVARGALAAFGQRLATVAAGDLPVSLEEFDTLRSRLGDAIAQMARIPGSPEAYRGTAATITSLEKQLHAAGERLDQKCQMLAHAQAYAARLAATEVALTAERTHTTQGWEPVEAHLTIARQSHQAIHDLLCGPTAEPWENLASDAAQRQQIGVPLAKAARLIAAYTGLRLQYIDRLREVQASLAAFSKHLQGADRAEQGISLGEFTAQHQAYAGRIAALMRQPPAPTTYQRGLATCRDLEQSLNVAMSDLLTKRERWRQICTFEDQLDLQQDRYAAERALTPKGLDQIAEEIALVAAFLQKARGMLGEEAASWREALAQNRLEAGAAAPLRLIDQGLEQVERLRERNLAAQQEAVEQLRRLDQELILDQRNDLAISLAEFAQERDRWAARLDEREGIVASPSGYEELIDLSARLSGAMTQQCDLLAQKRRLRDRAADQEQQLGHLRDQLDEERKHTPRGMEDLLEQRSAIRRRLSLIVDQLTEPDRPWCTEVSDALLKELEDQMDDLHRMVEGIEQRRHQAKRCLGEIKDRLNEFERDLRRHGSASPRIFVRDDLSWCEECRDKLGHMTRLISTDSTPRAYSLIISWEQEVAAGISQREGQVERRKDILATVPGLAQALQAGVSDMEKHIESQRGVNFHVLRQNLQQISVRARGIMRAIDNLGSLQQLERLQHELAEQLPGAVRAYERELAESLQLYDRLCAYERLGALIERVRNRLKSLQHRGGIADHIVSLSKKTQSVDQTVKAALPNKLKPIQEESLPQQLKELDGAILQLSRVVEGMIQVGGQRVRAWQERTRQVQAIEATLPSIRASLKHAQERLGPGIDRLQAAVDELEHFWESDDGLSQAVIHIDAYLHEIELYQSAGWNSSLEDYVSGSTGPGRQAADHARRLQKQVEKRVQQALKQHSLADTERQLAAVVDLLKREFGRSTYHHEVHDNKQYHQRYNTHVEHADVLNQGNDAQIYAPPGGRPMTGRTIRLDNP